jgi:cation diffusion facilitator CzcD-associated flavoprotein CzcO
MADLHAGAKGMSKSAASCSIYPDLSAHEFGDWLGSYAQAMELNVWTSTTVESVSRNEREGNWILKIAKSDGSKRSIAVQYVVLAVGVPLKPPAFPGKVSSFHSEPRDNLLIYMAFNRMTFKAKS